MLYIMEMRVYYHVYPRNEVSTIPVLGKENNKKGVLWMGSILTSIKKMLSIEEEYEHFDPDILMHINSAFSILTQLGVGPDSGFMIMDKNATWDDFIKDEAQLNLVKSYMFVKVKLLFDPPMSTAVLECYKAQVSEYESRLNVTAENAKMEEVQNG